MVLHELLIFLLVEHLHSTACCGDQFTTILANVLMCQEVGLVLVDFCLADYLVVERIVVIACTWDDVLDLIGRGEKTCKRNNSTRIGRTIALLQPKLVARQLTCRRLGHPGDFKYFLVVGV